MGFVFFFLFLFLGCIALACCGAFSLVNNIGRGIDNHIRRVVREEMRD